jgi:outer membrane protein OmpA-like peptidoglycan-associated protein
MRSSRTSERWTTRAALFVLIGQVLVAGGPAAAAAGQDTLLPPTPLVLKDGRIANVSIHELPFDRGDGELASDAAADLARLTAEVATDCFLTAQVIGHVSSREVADNETLAAHRLARSRADAVQSSLIGGGLPAKSIASVWDWQFLVREPRATLWVFRLIQGEDCEGLPLDGEELVAENVPAQAQPAQAAVSHIATPVAQAGAAAAPASEAVPAPDPAPQVAEVVAPPALVSAPEPVAQAAPTLPPMVGSAVAAEAPPAEEVSEAPIAEAATRPEGGEPGPAGDHADGSAGDPLQEPGAEAAMADSEGGPIVVPAGSTRDPVPTVTRPIPALSPATAVAAADAGQADTAVAALEPGAVVGGGTQRSRSAAPAAQQTAKPQDPERQGKVAGQDGDVEITFATNSSYFPPDTARRLGALLDGMASDQRYQVELRVGVSGADKVVGATTPEQARRYNQWLAERRVGRVQEWLAEHAQDRQLEIEPIFSANDSSRRVLVRVVPAT